jgi:hypothetical protein
MKYNLYHLPYDDDALAGAALTELEQRIHQRHGLLWISRSRGNGRAYLVVCLPTTTDPETRQELLGAASPVDQIADQPTLHLFDEAYRQGIEIEESGPDEVPEEGGHDE